MTQHDIERTRCPVPTEEDAQKSTDFSVLISSADLIGYFSDRQYMRKISALFVEFSEIEEAAKVGCTAAACLRQGYPSFFWKIATSFITEDISFLR